MNKTRPESVIIYCSENWISACLSKVMQYILVLLRCRFKSCWSQLCYMLKYRWLARTVFCLSADVLCTGVQYCRAFTCVWCFCTSPPGNQSIIYFLKRLWVVLSHHKTYKANKSVFLGEMWAMIMSSLSKRAYIYPSNRNMEGNWCARRQNLF